MTLGVRVWLAYPRWRLSCHACETYMLDVETGEPHRDPATGDVLLRGSAPTPCESCPKVPGWAKAKGLPTPELRSHADELDRANRSALAYYYRMKAVGWPEPAKSDPVCQWYAGLIRDAEDEWAVQAAERSYQATITVLEVMARVKATRT